MRSAELERSREKGYLLAIFLIVKCENQRNVPVACSTT